MPHPSSHSAACTFAFDWLQAGSAVIHRGQNADAASLPNITCALHLHANNGTTKMQMDGCGNP